MGLGSGIRDPGSGKNPSRIQVSERHRIPDPDPQHCCGAEPAFELRPAIQQASALPAEPRCTLRATLHPIVQSCINIVLHFHWGITGTKKQSPPPPQKKTFVLQRSLQPSRFSPEDRLRRPKNSSKYEILNFLYYLESFWSSWIRIHQTWPNM